VKNEYDAYTVNNITAKPAADGSVVVQFGGCDGKIPNCLPIEKGWNYTVRLYRPRPEILEGSWKFPEAQPVAAYGTKRTCREASMMSANPPKADISVALRS
jgi:hypothetical protein